MSLSQVQNLAAQTVAAVAAGHNLADELACITAEYPGLSPQDKGMLQDLAYGVQRYAGSLRWILGKLLNKPLAEPVLEGLLLVAMYQLAYTRNAPHAVVNEAVGNAARIGRGQYRPFANAVLRRFQRERDKWLAQCRHDDTARYNLPVWWKQYLQNHYPKHWHNIAAAFQAHPPLTLRVNRRKTDAARYLAVLKEAGIAAKALGGDAVRLTEPMPVPMLPYFSEGFVSVQDFGAQQAALLLNVQNGERVLDACAAPGGKTGHILESADCRLTALDIDAARLQKVADNLIRLGFSTTAPDGAVLHCVPVQDLAAWYDGEPFDAVLADIPCTASGTLKRNPDIKWLRRPADAAKTARQQEVLLDALWQVLKPGGRMLLATCSLFEEENQMQCRRFLARCADAELLQELLLLPNDKQDGFYYALIRKK